MKNPKKKFPCPACQKEIIYDTSNEFRPFCSSRCKTLDQAAWASDEYLIAGKDNTAPETDDEAFS